MAGASGRDTGHPGNPSVRRSKIARGVGTLLARRDGAGRPSGAPLVRLDRGQEEGRIDGLEADAVHLLNAAGDGDIPEADGAGERLERLVRGRQGVDGGDVDGDPPAGGEPRERGAEDQV